MNWVKRGRILAGAGHGPWHVSHAAVPIADQIRPDTYRIYFSGRDALNQSHTSAALLMFRSGDLQLKGVRVKPLLSPGRLGAFDDSGAMATWLVRDGERRYLYYVGWNRGVTVPFRNAIGLAVSDDGGETYHRVSEGPVLDRDTYDPFFTASPCVLIENGRWRMWYVSCVEWVLEHGRPRHRYLIKYAESSDGIRWQRTGIVAIGFASAGEYAISRPSVIRDRDLYRMWYSHRGGAYRIGYAESPDGIHWRRADEEVGIAPGPEQWDSEAIAYPFVFDSPWGRCMLYNGNDYGRDGIGVAVLDVPS